MLNVAMRDEPPIAKSAAPWRCQPMRRHPPMHHGGTCSSPRAGLRNPKPHLNTDTLPANHGVGGAPMCLRSRIIAPARPRSFRVLPLSILARAGPFTRGDRGAGHAACYVFLLTG